MNQAVKRLYAAFIAACLCLNVLCASVSLAWDANTEPDVAGYRVYYSTLLGEELVVDAGMETSVTISNLRSGSLYRFYATAYNESGLESAPSSILEYLVPGLPAPTPLGAIQISDIALQANGLGITFATALGVLYVLEANDDFPSDTWKPVELGILGTGLSVTVTDTLWNSAPRRVYRIAATPTL